MNSNQCFDGWGYPIDCDSNSSTSTNQYEEQCFDEWGYAIDCNSNSNNKLFDDIGHISIILNQKLYSEKYGTYL